MIYLVDTHYLLRALIEPAQVPGSITRILDASVESGFKVLDVAEEDIVTSHRPPFIENHRDPFDRLIVWQCIRNGIVLLTADGRLRGYEPHGLGMAL